MEKRYCDKKELWMYDLGSYTAVDWKKLGLRSGDGKNNDDPYCTNFWITYKDNHYWIEEKYAIPYLEQANGTL